MKRKFVLIAALFVALLALAKDHVIVVKGQDEPIKTSTEVEVGEGGLSDTLTVTPAIGIERIYVTLRSSDGTVLESHNIPANFNGNLVVLSPTFPEGYMLEIRDDQGVVYRRFDF